jgi:hypothetical protein
MTNFWNRSEERSRDTGEERKEQEYKRGKEGTGIQMRGNTGDERNTRNTGGESKEFEYRLGEEAAVMR